MKRRGKASSMEAIGGNMETARECYQMVYGEIEPSRVEGDGILLRILIKSHSSFPQESSRFIDMAMVQ